MNKKAVEKYLPLAIEALNDPQCKIQDKNSDESFSGKISKTYRGQISSFGAAVTMGSFKAAVAFFSNKAGSSVEREQLVRAMYYIVKTFENENKKAEHWKDAPKIAEEIIKTPQENIPALKEKFINASLALKLAMNAFDLYK